MNEDLTEYYCHCIWCHDFNNENFPKTKDELSLFLNKMLECSCPFDEPNAFHFLANILNEK